MRKLIVMTFAISALCCASPINTMALPVDGLGIDQGSTGFSSVQDSRWFCASRWSGQFLHWGRCGGGGRVYCRNRFTGRFLHWGYC